MGYGEDSLGFEGFWGWIHVGRIGEVPCVGGEVSGEVFRY